MPTLMECETEDASDSQELRSIDAQLDDFLALVAASDQSALLLDFDGTLAPFRIDPTKVKPWAGVTKLLDDIQQTGRTRIAIISGRPARDVVLQLGMPRPPEIWGLHGAERMLPNGQVYSDDLLPHQRTVLETAKSILHTDGFTIRQGLRLEEKWNAVAVHWRGKSEQSTQIARQQMYKILSPFAERAGMKLLLFDGGVELRAGRDKGGAVHLLLSEMQPDAPVAFMGDDITDEDAFLALAGRGLSILTRRDWRPSAAQLWLRPPAQLRSFLSGWLRALRY
jgi:trehalose 6-phosphate phosphatase